MEAKRKRRIRRTLTGLVIFYISSGIALYLLQDVLFFHPKPLPPGHRFQFNQPFKEINIPVENRNLNLIQFAATSPTPKGVILYFHGNMRNVERYAPFMPVFTKKGYEVWMMDYAGFGKSTGKRTEQSMYEDAMRIYWMAAEKFPVTEIIIYGRSIGSGVASWLASKEQVQQLLLETPYYSIAELARHYAPIYPVQVLSKYEFPIYQFLQNIKIPVTIFHGTNDELIPYKQAKRLGNIEGVRLITIPGVEHNNLSTFPVYQTTIDTLLK